MVWDILDAGAMDVSYEQLHATLQDVYSGVYNGKETDIFQAIQAARPQLQKLLDLGPKSADERKMVTEGVNLSLALIYRAFLTFLFPFDATTEPLLGRAQDPS